MKNVTVVFNLVLVALVGVLFYLYFGLKKSDNSVPTGSSSVAGKSRLIRIAHVNVDTLNAKYQLMLDFKREMESRQNSIQNEYDAKAKIAQQEYVAYQQKMQSGAISANDADKMQKDLQQKKNGLDEVQRRLDELSKEAQQRNSTILSIVQKYVANYNKKMHFDYVLAYAKVGANILYANDSLDVTKDVLAGLNLQYKDSLQKASSATQH